MSPPKSKRSRSVANSIQVQLEPGGQRFSVPSGATLRDRLFACGIEFPCGGHGRCKGCRVKVIHGSLPVTAHEARLLTPAELAEGWRLACQAIASSDLALEIGQWETPILTDESEVRFTPRPGLGVAVDLGTTTLVAQLVDLSNGRTLAVKTALNCQAQYGADLMSRIEFGLTANGQSKLTRLIRDQIGRLIEEMLETQPQLAGELTDVVVVGNTVMHHLFCGLDLEPLSRSPFETGNGGLHVFRAADLGWKCPGQLTVRFLPCLGGFVGSDILAGLLATQLHQSGSPQAMIDLGTNGEVVVGHRRRVLCASTAAGPAFEGAHISVGMRAVTGAISAVTIRDGALQSSVLGRAAPRGICGSGLVDAAASGLDLKWIEPSGKLSGRTEIVLAPGLALQQRDVRELQLAKAAIASAFHLLLRRLGVALDDLTRIYLAGAFGNYINCINARRVGLVCAPPERIQPAGNTALRGAKIALCNLQENDGSCVALLQQVEHIRLNEDPEFEEMYVAQLRFPEPHSD